MRIVCFMSKQSTCRFLVLMLLTLMLLLESGCVRRRMFIRAFPEGNAQMPITGAMVYVNKQPVGRTPVTCNFTHYGTMEFTLVKEGYEPLTEYRKIRAPWYQWPGIDFFSEVVWPQEITDNKQLDFQMKPARIITQDELVERAEALRRESQALATFRADSGTTTGIINPVTNVPGSSITNDFETGTSLESGEIPSGAGSIGAPTSPFVNPPQPQNPWSGTTETITPGTMNPYM